MKNPFGRARHSSGAYSPKVMELAHGLPLQDREESDKKQDSHSAVSSEAIVSSGTIESTSEILVQNTTSSSATDAGSSTAEGTTEIQTQNITLSEAGAGSSSTIESISEIPTQNITPSATDAGVGTAESPSGITPPNDTSPSDAGTSNREGRKKSIWRRFFLKLLCLGSGGNDSDSEVYHPDPHTDEQHTSTSDAIADEQRASTGDEEVIQQDATTPPSVEVQEITNDPVNADPHDIEHPRPADNTPKKRGILYRFFSKLLCLGSGKNEPEVVAERDSSDSLQHMLTPQDPDAGTYVPFERCDEDISAIRVRSDTSPVEEASMPSSSQPTQDINVHVEHNTPSIDEVETLSRLLSELDTNVHIKHNIPSIEEPSTSSKLLSELDTTSKQHLKKDSSKLQPIIQLKKQRPVGYYHISPATDADASTSYSSANRSTDTQTPLLLRNNPDNGVSFSQLRKSSQTHSVHDISTIYGSATLDAQGKLQQKSTSFPNLRSIYLPSGRTIECTYNVQPNDASLQKVGNMQDLSAVEKAAPASKKSKGNILRSSHSSPLTIHEEHEQPLSAYTFADIRSTMRKINRPRFSKAYQDVLSKEHPSFAEKISCTPQTTRSDSVVSKIISLFEEKGVTVSQNLPKDLSSTIRR